MERLRLGLYRPPPPLDMVRDVGIVDNIEEHLRTGQYQFPRGCSLYIEGGINSCRGSDIQTQYKVV
jgi:hypothetical protein